MCFNQNNFCFPLANSCSGTLYEREKGIVQKSLNIPDFLISTIFQKLLEFLAQTNENCPRAALSEAFVVLPLYLQSCRTQWEEPSHHKTEWCVYHEVCRGKYEANTKRSFLPPLKTNNPKPTLLGYSWNPLPALRWTTGFWNLTPASGQCLGTKCFHVSREPCLPA